MDISTERDVAFIGLIRIIQAKPLLLTNTDNIHGFLDACISWDEPPDNEEIYVSLQQILYAIKNEQSIGWNVASQMYSNEQIIQLKDIFRIN